MIEVLKFLLEQPGKFGQIALNLLRLLLTLMIANVIPSLFKYNFPNHLNAFDGSLHIGFLFLYIIWIGILWIVIWELFDLPFSFLITWRKAKDKQKKDDDLLVERQTIGQTLKFFGVSSIENEDFKIPKKPIHVVTDFIEFIDKNDSLNLAKSFVSNLLYLLVVGWIYFLCNAAFFHFSICCFILSGIVLFLMGIGVRGLDRIAILVNDHTDDLRRTLERLEYRKMIIDIVVKDFRGRINMENKSFDIKWGNRSYSINDYYYYHGGIGNVMLIKKIKAANAPNWTERILVLNFQPNDELKTLLHEKRIIGVVVANSNEELLDNLVEELNRLNELYKEN